MTLITDALGRVLGGRYRLAAPLGLGSSAHVYLAEDLVLQRRVAVKVLQPSLVGDEAFLKRFRAESRAAASLNHPHVMRVFDWGEDPDGPYLVLEYLGGGSLRELLDHGGLLDIAQAVRVGREAAEGLAYAHRQGLVHRDVKPANLVFDEDGRVRVADFGVARALAAAAWTEPVGAMVGTIRYASPEQAQGVAVAGSTDVYALALVLYEAVTGVVPFVEGDQVTTLMARVGATLPPHPALGVLAPLLVAAAAPGLADRPGADDLARSLATLAAELPPPAPLPLQVARPQAGPPTDRPPDVTIAGGTAAAARTAAFVAADQTAAILEAPAATAGFPGSTGVRLPPPPVIAQRPDRRRRWPWKTTLLLVVLALAAGAVLAVRDKLFVPSHPTPALAGTSLAAAHHELSVLHLSMHVDRAAYSTTVIAGDVISQTPAPRVSVKEGSVVTVVPSKGLPPERVPSLSGLDCAGAQQFLSYAHLAGSCPPGRQEYSTTVAKGLVITWYAGSEQQPAEAPWHSTITIVLSLGPPPVAVPTVPTSSYQAAAAALSAKGFTATESLQSDAKVPAGQVIGTTPAGGQQIPQGSTVTVDVSSGPPDVTVPASLVGETLAEATAALHAVGLEVGHVSGSTTGVVASASPGIGQSVPEGTSVSLTMQKASPASSPAATPTGPGASGSQGAGAAKGPGKG